MDLEAAKKLIKKYTAGHADFVARAAEGDRYYHVQNDILFRPAKKGSEQESIDAVNPLRQADNRIPFSFHKLLVNQKAGYKSR